MRKVWQVGGCGARSVKPTFVMLVCFSCLLVSGLSGSAAAAQDTAADKRAIIQLESKWLDALNRGDTDRIANILDDDFVRPAPDAGRFVGKAALLQFYRAHPTTRKTAPRRMKIVSVDIYGTVAIARGVVTVPALGQARESKLLFTDIFVRRREGWQAVSAQEDPIPQGG
ncbi:MAG TPA: nuclear transport factor 2 family protein [Rhizomicrobium sp.]|jgi:ketosteroid isomerase-like protein|nr:nuclear transport factor 2 family protein [Rhizomicrobium sp.]